MKGWSLAYESINTWKQNRLSSPGKKFQSRKLTLSTLYYQQQPFAALSFVVVNYKNGRQKPLKFSQTGEAIFI